MTEPKPLICFIDDSPQERELFQTVFGGDEGRFRVICAETFCEAQELIKAGEEQPELFVLDLYFPGGEGTNQPIEVIEPPTWVDDGGEINKAYLNLEQARKRFMALRAALGQTPAGGLKLLLDVQDAYPGIPAITYTRKGTIEEADLARKTGAMRVLQKPSGDDWEETIKLTHSRRAELERCFQQTIDQNPYELLSLITHYARLFVPADERDDIAAKILTIRKKLLAQPDYRIEDEEIDVLMDCTLHPLIRALMYQLGRNCKPSHPPP
ncbi:MAG: hypothetical protein NTW14_04180 [bacterium]|nr:hypothetical protein [bacterium]